jgi:single-stranded DNA-binding protein
MEARMSINVVVLAGNLTRDPELKATPTLQEQAVQVAGRRLRGLLGDAAL